MWQPCHIYIYIYIKEINNEEAGDSITFTDAELKRANGEVSFEKETASPEPLELLGSSEGHPGQSGSFGSPQAETGESPESPGGGEGHLGPSGLLGSPQAETGESPAEEHGLDGNVGCARALVARGVDLCELQSQIIGHFGDSSLAASAIKKKIAEMRRSKPFGDG